MMMVSPLSVSAYNNSITSTVSCGFGSILTGTDIDILSDSPMLFFINNVVLPTSTAGFTVSIEFNVHIGATLVSTDLKEESGLLYVAEPNIIDPPMPCTMSSLYLNAVLSKPTADVQFRGTLTLDVPLDYNGSPFNLNFLFYSTYDSSHSVVLSRYRQTDLGSGLNYNVIKDNRVPVNPSVTQVSDSQTHDILNDVKNQQQQEINIANSINSTLQTTAPVSSEVSSINKELGSVIDDYDTRTDTSSQFVHIEDANFFQDGAISIIANLASTTTFFGSMVTGMLDSFGDFQIPLVLFISLCFVGTVLKVSAHVNSSEYTGTRGHKRR